LANGAEALVSAQEGIDRGREGGIRYQEGACLPSVFNSGRKIMIYEIRNYHFRPDLIDAYKAWAKNEAIPHLASQLDVLGFWINSKDAPELNGAPQDPLGTANVTWIIRWRDLAQRNEVLPRILSSPAWQDIFSRVPEGSASYLRIEAKFADALM
jgi:hypothetical protein